MMNTLEIDQSIQALKNQKNLWACLPIQDKLSLLIETRDLLEEFSQQIVDASVSGKHIDPSSPWVGEEWILGPWTLAESINGYITTLKSLLSGQLAGLERVSTRSDGQIAAQVFPNSFYDRLVLSGFHSEVWMQPEISLANLKDHTATFYNHNGHKGKIALVLGSGNISAIPILDALYRLFAFGHVVVLKMNPINDYVGPIYESVFARFIERGFLRFVYGGADLGDYLVHHPDVDEIHLTGNSQTHDIIVYGDGPEGEARKKLHTPELTKPVTCELNCICPTIVVPGQWSKADIRFQAENIVTMKMNNVGFNCASLQVLILPETWAQRNEFLDAIRDVIRKLPPRDAYFPGTADRQRAAVKAYPQAEVFNGDIPATLIANLNADTANTYGFTHEFFGPILTQVNLPGSAIDDYLNNAVEFCNTRLFGNLGATLIIHPDTHKKSAQAVDKAISDLRYGAVGINVWHAMAFLIGQATWGAYPTKDNSDIQSGTGVVRNSNLFEKPQKTVCYGPFYPFPRGILHGSFSVMPKPPWFVTNKSAHITLQKISRFAVNPDIRQLPGILFSALKG